MKQGIDKQISQNLATALISLPLSLVIGLIVRETTRGAGARLGIADFQVASAFLNLSHGHFLVLFGVIPLILAAVLWISRENLSEGNGKTKKIALFTSLYHLGATGTFALMMIKGYAQVNGYVPGIGLAMVEASFLGGPPLRAILYAIAHISLFVAMTSLALTIIRKPKARA